MGRTASEADAVIDTAISRNRTLTTEALRATATTIIDGLPDTAPFNLTVGAGVYGATPSITAEETRHTLGPAAGMLALSADSSNEGPQRLPGWQPHGTDLLEDLTAGSYRTA